jgi:acetate kinase
MKILVINAGSSSLKYQLFDMETEQVLAKGLCERIGLDGYIKHSPLIGGKPVHEGNLSMPTHAEAMQAVLKLLVSQDYGVLNSIDEIDADRTPLTPRRQEFHRVLHRGRRYARQHRSQHPPSTPP